MNHYFDHLSLSLVFIFVGDLKALILFRKKDQRFKTHDILKCYVNHLIFWKDVCRPLHSYPWEHKYRQGIHVYGLVLDPPFTQPYNFPDKVWVKKVVTKSTCLAMYQHNFRF